MGPFPAQCGGPSTLDCTVDRREDDEKQELNRGHQQLSCFGFLISTGVVEGDAEKQPFCQKRCRHLEATVGAQAADIDGKKKPFRKELHQNSGVAASRSRSCSRTTFVQDDGKFHAKEARKEVVHWRELGEKVVKGVTRWTASTVKACLTLCCGEVAVDEAESELLLQERPQECRSKSVACEDDGDGERKKPLYPERHPKSTVGDDSDHTAGSNYSALAETPAQAIGGSELNVTLAKSPQKDMCVESDHGDGDQVGGASAEFIATAVQRTDDVVESVARRNTAEYLVEDGIAAEDIITVNIAGPGQPAEVLGGLSLPGFLHTIEMCPHI